MAARLSSLHLPRQNALFFGIIEGRHGGELYNRSFLNKQCILIDDY